MSGNSFRGTGVCRKGRCIVLSSRKSVFRRVTGDFFRFSSLSVTLEWRPTGLQSEGDSDRQGVRVVAVGGG